MRHREQGRHRPLDPGQRGGAVAGGEHEDRERQRQEGREQPAGQREADRGPDPGRRRQLAPGRERELLAAERRQVAERGQQRPEQAGDDRPQEYQQGERGQVAQQRPG